MKICNESSSTEERSLQVLLQENTGFNLKEDDIRAITCPSCGHSIQVLHQGILHDLPGLPAGVKFDPSDQEILGHLEAKVLLDKRETHPLIDEFIPTIEGENGICYTHPEKLPGVSKDGQIRHFFHRPLKAYTTGTRKRRKILTDEDGGETRWHKTGKTRPIFTGRALKGYKKILVLYSNYGRHRKPQKTNWIMHQYHLGDSEEERDGELVVSKVFYQTQPRQPNGVVTKGPPQQESRTSSSLVTQWTCEDPKYISMMKNTNVVDYDFSGTQNFVTYNVGCSQSRESPPLLIPNPVTHGQESPFIHLPSMANDEICLRGGGQHT